MQDAKVKHFPEWHTEVVNTLLAEIDGVEQRKGVAVIAACNHPQKLDPALIGSGRLDRHIAIEAPGPRHLLSASGSARRSTARSRTSWTPSATAAEARPSSPS